MKWHEAAPVDDHHFQGNVRHSSPNSPAIIINAAAAAASGRPYESHRIESHPYPDIDSVEIVHKKPPRQQPIESSTEEEEDELDDDSAFHNDEGDFFVLRRNRKKQRKTERHREKQRERHESRSRHRSSPYSRHRNREKPKHEYIDDFEDYRERKSISLEPRSLASLETGADGVEGDVFQYEDFDFDTDNVYADSESGENQNSSWTPAGKERNTQDGLRHRRVYTKWSRWSKCSPKCTTRRYK